MASGLTPIFSIPYPQSTDPVDVATDMEDLAKKVEDVLAVKSNLNSNNVFSGTQTIGVDTTTPALKITQTGTGAALLVEDSTSTDATPFIITGTGNVGIGTTAPAHKLHVVGTNTHLNSNASITGTLTVDGAALFNSGITAYGEYYGYDAVSAGTSFILRDIENSLDIRFSRPATLTGFRVLTLPDVNGTVVTTGNRNDAYPSQAGNSGEFLTTDGTNVSWATLPNLVPDVTGNSGEFLTTDGTTYYWDSINLVPDLDPTSGGTGTAGKWLTNNGSSIYWDFLPGQAEYIEVTSDFTASVGANLFCDTRGGSFTVTMPTNPLPGTTVSVFDVQNFFQSQYVIIEPGDKKINSRDGVLYLDVGGATVVFVYINETIGWRVT